MRAPGKAPMKRELAIKLLQVPSRRMIQCEAPLRVYFRNPPPFLVSLCPDKESKTGGGVYLSRYLNCALSKPPRKSCRVSKSQ